MLTMPKKHRFSVYALGALFCLMLCLNGQTFAQDASPKVQTFKILHIMSYHLPWKWTEDQLRGFKAVLADQEVEYKVFEMDTKNHSDEAWKTQKGEEARALIDEWQPDLVYTNDDNAQKYVTQHYLNQDLPFVFSGVNATPESYGFDKASNVSGVLEQEHSIQTLRLLHQLAPQVKKVAILIDDGPTWPRVIKRLKARLHKLPAIEVVSWDVITSFSDYQAKVLAYQDSVDAIGNLGIFGYKDENGDNVHYQKVLRWTAENSRLPDFSFWLDRVSHGTLCAVGVSGYEQGHAAGEIARQILVDGVKPADIPIKPTVKGEPWVSLARLRALGLSLSSTPLLSSHVVKNFSWSTE